MATVASQLILHPVVSQGLKVLSTTVGRDKVRVWPRRLYLCGLRSFQGLSGLAILCEILRLVAPFFQQRSRCCKVERSQIPSCIGAQVCVVFVSSRVPLTCYPPSVEIG